jgi:hypothetical protein
MAFRIDKSITQDNWITADRMAADSVDSIELVNSSVITDKIANLNVTNPKLADLAVSTAKISGSAVTTDKIADDAVTTAKIFNGSVTSDKLASSSVLTAKIADDNVTRLKLNADIVSDTGVAYSDALGIHISGGMVTDSMLANPGALSTGEGFVLSDGSVAITAGDQEIATLSVTDTAQSTSTSTGALTVAGGVGIAKRLNVGESLDVAGYADIVGFLNVDSTATISGATHIGSTLTVDGDTTINGNLFVEGTTTTIHSTELTVTDNAIIINEGEAGSTVTSVTAGIEIDRGTGKNYMFLFDDATDNFKIGEFDNLQPVATREDDSDMEDGGIALWSSSNVRLETSAAFVFDGTNFSINSTQAVSSIDTVIDGTSVHGDLISALGVKNYVDTVAASISSAGLQNVVEDLSPELGGDLDVLSRSIVSSTSFINLDGGLAFGHRSVAISTTLGNDDHVLYCTAGGISVDLPAGVAGRTFKIMCNSSAGTGSPVTINANGSDTILGAATLDLDNPYAAVTLVSNGIHWSVL